MLFLRGFQHLPYKYEQHADDVAARVGAGQSAGDLLAEYSNKSAQENIVTQASEMVQQQLVERPKGASTFSDVNKTTLQGHYHKIPLETPMPKGLNVMADGKEVNGPHQATHHTIFPVERMLFLTFSELFLSLPWKYAGRK